LRKNSARYCTLGVFPFDFINIGNDFAYLKVRIVLKDLFTVYH